MLLLQHEYMEMVRMMLTLRNFKTNVSNLKTSSALQQSTQPRSTLYSLVEIIPHKAVAEVSKIGNLLEKLVVVN